MKKLKDFFYNKNDIIIVLLIVAAAAFVIYDRIGAIMEYPETYAKEAAETETSAVVAEETTEATEASDADSNENTEGATSGEGTITIDDSDTSSSVADKLQAAGLISSADTFESYINESGKSGSILSGTFQIPAGSTDEEILNIITQ